MGQPTESAASGPELRVDACIKVIYGLVPRKGAKNKVSGNAAQLQPMDSEILGGWTANNCPPFMIY